MRFLALVLVLVFMKTLLCSADELGKTREQTFRDWNNSNPCAAVPEDHTPGWGTATLAVGGVVCTFAGPVGILLSVASATYTVNTVLEARRAVSVPLSEQWRCFQRQCAKEVDYEQRRQMRNELILSMGSFPPITREEWDEKWTFIGCYDYRSNSPKSFGIPCENPDCKWGAAVGW
jgi:hypothetical protein